jgi:hypothetical protein
MKRVGFSIDEALDEALHLEAIRRNTTKAALVRRFVVEGLSATGSLPDPMVPLIGDIDAEASDIDAVVYEARPS